MKKSAIPPTIEIIAGNGVINAYKTLMEARGVTNPVNHSVYIRNGSAQFRGSITTRWFNDWLFEHYGATLTHVNGQSVIRFLDDGSSTRFILEWGV